MSQGQISFSDYELQQQAATERTDLSLTVHAACDRTKAFYEDDLQAYIGWATDWNKTAPLDQRIERPLPARPIDIANWIDHLRNAEGYAYPTITRKLAAISRWHKDRNIDNPRKSEAVKAELKRCFTEGVKASVETYATLDTAVRKMIEKIDLEYDVITKKAAPTERRVLAYLRERALVLTMFFAGLSKGEASSLYVGNVISIPDGRDGKVLRVNPAGEIFNKREGTFTWRNAGRFREVEILAAADPRFCAVTAIERWLKVSGLVGKHGEHLFRGILPDAKLTKFLSSTQIHDVIKFRLRSIGDERWQSDVEMKRKTPHSLRKGIVASIAFRAPENDPEVDEIMLQKVGTKDLTTYRSTISKARMKRRDRHAEDYLIL